MSKKIREYTLPVLGHVQIIHEEEDYKPYGEYYVRVERYGVSGRFSKTAEEAERKMLENIESYLLEQKRGLETSLEKLDKGLKEIIKIQSRDTHTPEVNSGEETK